MLVEVLNGSRKLTEPNEPNRTEQTSNPAAIKLDQVEPAEQPFEWRDEHRKGDDELSIADFNEDDDREHRFEWSEPQDRGGDRKELCRQQDSGRAPSPRDNRTVEGTAEEDSSDEQDREHFEASGGSPDGR